MFKSSIALCAFKVGWGFGSSKGSRLTIDFDGQPCLYFLALTFSEKE